MTKLNEIAITALLLASVVFGLVPLINYFMYLGS
jgi:hypothetical protein